MSLARHLSFAATVADLRAQLAERDRQLTALRGHYRIACAVIEEHFMSRELEAAIEAGTASRKRKPRAKRTVAFDEARGE